MQAWEYHILLPLPDEVVADFEPTDEVQTEVVLLALMISHMKVIMMC